MSERVAIITGGTGGLGQALVPRLLGDGYRLAVTYIVPEEARALEKAVNADKETLLLRRVDSTDPESLEAFTQEVAASFSEIHGLCCLVGGWAGGRDVEETDDLRFERMLDVNLRSTFYAMRACLPHLRKASWGRIVTIASRAAIEAPGGQAAFNAAKAGVVALTRSVAAELRGTEITANSVLPAVIDTPATRAAMPYADYVDWPTPDEIAAVIQFIMSPASSVITGATIPVYADT